MIRIELDSVRKDSNKSEWRMVQRASAEGFESVGDGHNIKLLCKMLIEAGHSGEVEVWRGKTPVFGAIDLHRWATGRALSGEQPRHLRKRA